MKKILILIISALYLIPIASAQIQITKRNSFKTLISLRMGMVSLEQKGEDFYLMLLSDNPYDNPYIIHLGNGKKASMESLESLIDIADTIKKHDIYEIDMQKERLTITRGLIKSEIWIKSIYKAGYGKTSMGELKRLLDKLTFDVY